MRTSRRRRDEQGTVTLWVLGLCVSTLFLGGLGLDLWRAVAVRRDLSAAVDAAATAGANGLDEGALRAGALRLDAARAQAFARDVLAREGRRTRFASTRVDVSGNVVTVTAEATVDLSLLDVFVDGPPLRVRAVAAAEPRRRP